MTDEGRLLTDISERITECYELRYGGDAPFVPGETFIPVASQVNDVDDMFAVVEVALSLQFAAGLVNQKFESDLAMWHGDDFHASSCNSGSSANLLAISALMSRDLKEGRLLPGDEVITTAIGFPTTLNAILQNQLTPVFVDVDPKTYNADPEQIDDACSELTRAIFLPHTLGNPFDVDSVKEIVSRRGLWLVEDNCDSFGSKYNGWKTGTFGDLSTLSFYPAHHLSTGEGGAVVSSSNMLEQIVESLRDWGRDCRCSPGHDNACGRRFGMKFGDLPYGYDHKYVYSHIGYNLKMTEMQAALGVSQLRKLEDFGRRRKHNWKCLRDGLADLDGFFVLPDPQAKSDPSWFGFAFTVREDAPFSRDDIVLHLESNQIGTRMMLGGNLIRQPAYKEMIYRSIGSLESSCLVMNSAFWIGVHPALTGEMVDYMIDVIRSFCLKT